MLTNYAKQSPPTYLLRKSKAKEPKNQRDTMLFCFQWLLDKCFLAKSLQPPLLISFLIIPSTITNISDNYFLLLNLSKVNKKALVFSPTIEIPPFCPLLQALFNIFIYYRWIVNLGFLKLWVFRLIPKRRSFSFHSFTLSLPRVSPLTRKIVWR